MTVEELIEELSKYPENKEILLQDSNGFNHFIDHLYEEYYDYKNEDVICLTPGQLA